MSLNITTSVEEKQSYWWLNNYLSAQQQRDFVDLEWIEYQQRVKKNLKILLGMYYNIINTKVTQQEADILWIPEQTLDKINQVLSWNTDIKLKYDEESLFLNFLNNIIKLRGGIYN